MKLTMSKDKWYAMFNGLIYANKPTDVITRIYNKQLIIELQKTQ